MKNVFAALCLFFSMISISCSAEIMSFIPNQTVRYKITQEMRAKEVADEEEECESYEAGEKTEVEVDVTILSDNEIVDSYPIEVECVIRDIKSSCYNDYDDDDDDDEAEYDLWINKPIRFYIDKGSIDEGSIDYDDDADDLWIYELIQSDIDEDNQIVIKREYDSEDAFYNTEKFDEFLDMFEPFLEATFCLVGKDLVSGKSYPINMVNWLEIDGWTPAKIYPIQTVIWLWVVMANSRESAQDSITTLVESYIKNGVFTENSNFVIGKMDEESIKGVMEYDSCFEIFLDEDFWDTLDQILSEACDDECDDEEESWLPLPPPLRIQSEVTLSGDFKWKRDNPLIHECCIQYTVYNSIVSYFEEATVQKKDQEQQYDCILKCEAILPSLPSKE